MPLPAELTKWVEEMRKAGLSDATLQSLEKDCERKDTADQFKRTVLAVADYSRQTQELQDQKTQLENYLGELKQWKDTQEIDLRKNSREALEYKRLHAEATDKLKVATQELGRLHDEGYTQLDLTKVTPTMPTPTPSPLPTNGESYLTKDELNKMRQEQEQQFLTLQSISAKITKEHFKLFGELPDLDRIMEIAVQRKQPIAATWESEYKVQAKRDEIKEKEIQDRINTEVAKQVATRVSEQALMGNVLRSDTDGSPIFKTLGEKNADGTPKSVPFKTADSEGLAKAMEAYRAGKFKPTTINP